MILDKGPRALILAGVFCVAAALGGGAGATEVYPGCAVPPTTFTHVWYIDPANGKTAAGGGLGTQAAPWNSLQAVFSVQPGYPAPLLSTAPYRHWNPATRANEISPGGGPVQPGDEILLMSGNYGDVSTSDWNIGLKNPGFVTVAAAPGQTPVLSWLATVGTSYFVFSGIKVEATADSSPTHARFALVLANSGATPSSNLVFTNMVVSSSDDTSGWTQADWRARRRTGGIFAQGGANTTCVSVTNSHISNVEFGGAVMANNMLFSDNEIDTFGDDGIIYGASDILITKNYIHNSLNLSDGAHPDGLQGYPGKFSNIVIDSNRVIRQTDPNLAFPGPLQGIDAFDGDWTNLTVTNNTVVTSSCWGIGYGSVHGGKIINNTALDDGSDVGTKNPAGTVMCRPQLAVGDKTHQGSSSNDVVIRNNIANKLFIDNRNPNMTMDHNICLGIGGTCQILTYVNGKPNFGVYKPGTYGDHNIIDRRGAVDTFASFDLAKFTYDLRLKPGASAIGAGSPSDAPPVDITGAPRQSPIDAGAYQYRPSK